MRSASRSPESEELRTAERSLVRRLLAGEEAAFESFSDDYLPRLYRFAAARLDGDRELTRDIVQSTVCKVIAGLDGFRGDSGLFTWICACCHNEIRMHFRKEKRTPSIVELDDEIVPEAASPQAVFCRPRSPEGEAIRGETRQLVHAVLDELPGDWGRALEWKYLGQISVAGIAERLGLSEKAAESLLTRARRRFKERFSDRTASPSKGEAPWASSGAGRR